VGHALEPNPADEALDSSRRNVLAASGGDLVSFSASGPLGPAYSHFGYHTLLVRLQFADERWIARVFVPGSPERGPGQDRCPSVRASR
jgi:hypothetical protein